jgi:hypothetical protein
VALPPNNVPAGKHVGCAKLSHNASENFGLFTPLEASPSNLELREVEEKGMDNENVGIGVFTKVLMLF